MTRPDGAGGRLVDADGAAKLVGQKRSLMWNTDISYPRALIDNWVRRGLLAAAGRADDRVQRFTELAVLQAEAHTRARAYAAWKRLRDHRLRCCDLRQHADPVE